MMMSTENTTLLLVGWPPCCKHFVWLVDRSHRLKLHFNVSFKCCVQW
jgi:hypothetical protein